MSVSAHDLAMLYTASLFKKLDTILETNRVPNVTTRRYRSCVAMDRTSSQSVEINTRAHIQGHG